MLGALPFVEDPDLSWSAAPALPQHLPPCTQLKVFWGSQDYHDHNFWLHLKLSKVEDFGHP